METAFPAWLRVGHLINVIFIVLLVRSGLEILSSHPRLYLGENTPPESAWLRFTRKRMPKDRLWTSDDEMESLNSVIALPGHSHLGMGRHWHFFSVIFWPLNGIVYYVLLFATGTWRTIVPTTWSVFPDAWHTAGVFLSGRLPTNGDPFDPIQQLSYFGAVFILGPLLIATGAAQSPALAARFPWYTRLFGGRQRARSLHFVFMAFFVLFLIVHVTMVMVDHFQENMANMITGGGSMSLTVAVLFALMYVVIIVGINVLATVVSLKRPRSVQRTVGAVIEPVRRALMQGLDSRQRCGESRITPFFRINGRPPESPEYGRMVETGFSSWRLAVGGLVKKPLELSLDDVKAMARSVQVTEHTCIQGWTGVAEWAGVRLSEIMQLCQADPRARYVVFRSLAYGDLDEYGHGDPKTKFYEVIPVQVARQDQTMLAYEMNNEPLTVPHGAPLRLRVEVQYGYKMVKWLEAIEFVRDYRTVGRGWGGHREDSKNFDWGAWI